MTKSVLGLGVISVGCAWVRACVCVCSTSWLRHTRPWLCVIVCVFMSATNVCAELNKVTRCKADCSASDRPSRSTRLHAHKHTVVTALCKHKRAPYRKICKNENENDDVVRRFDPRRVTVQDHLTSGRLPSLLGLLLLKRIDFRYRNKLALQKKKKRN